MSGCDPKGAFSSNQAAPSPTAILAPPIQPPTSQKHGGSVSSIGRAATIPCVSHRNSVGKPSSAVESLNTTGSYRRDRIATGNGRPRALCAKQTRTPLLLLALALTACAHQPLTRSCITQKQYEQLKNAEPPKVHDKLTGKADEDVRPLAGSALELRAWGHAMLDTLKICSTP